MRQRVIVFTLLTVSSVALTSCFIVKAPFKVANTVVKGTYRVTETVVTAPFDAYDSHRDHKEAEETDAKDSDKKEKGKDENLPSQSSPPADLPQ